jgi:hypothetical protein
LKEDVAYFVECKFSAERMSGGLLSSGHAVKPAGLYCKLSPGIRRSVPVGSDGNNVLELLYRLLNALH